MMEKHSFQKKVKKDDFVELVQQFRNAEVAWMERVERFASGGQTMEGFVALGYCSMEEFASTRKQTFSVYISLCNP